MTIRRDVWARADSTNDAVRLPALIEMSHSGPCQLNDIEVVGWADERKRRKAIHGVVSRLDRQTDSNRRRLPDARTTKQRVSCARRAGFEIGAYCRIYSRPINPTGVPALLGAEPAGGHPACRCTRPVWAAVGTAKE